MDKTIRRVSNVEEQDAENFRYWQSRPMSEVMQAVAEIVYSTYSFKGIDLDAQGTKDLDVVIALDHENSQAVYMALADFGAPLSRVTPGDFCGHPETVFQLGVPPSRVDINAGNRGGLL